eukprot:TRINITY_DN18259_c0_g1_i3.p1 TRINITY_DN18259_c0_g1~~TRINITY_DN18259_c0_g1_i3.p1  ORF type:complete len:250 (+),score=-4.61 TRINITY_DN18259_c0_g1_i3:407-1156(+)
MFRVMHTHKGRRATSIQSAQWQNKQSYHMPETPQQQPRNTKRKEYRHTASICQQKAALPRARQRQCECGQARHQQPISDCHDNHAESKTSSIGRKSHTHSGANIVVDQAQTQVHHVGPWQRIKQQGVPRCTPQRQSQQRIDGLVCCGKRHVTCAQKQVEKTHKDHNERHTKKLQVYGVTNDDKQRQSTPVHMIRDQSTQSQGHARATVSDQGYEPQPAELKGGGQLRQSPSRPRAGCRAPGCLGANRGS